MGGSLNKLAVLQCRHCMFEGICSEDRLVEVRTVVRREPGS